MQEVILRSLPAVAGRLRSSARQRFVFFLLATLANSFVIGYHAGTFDQIIHLPMLLAYAEPGAYAGDPIVTLRTQHFSFFWFAFVPALRLGLLEPAMLMVHLASIWATFAATWELMLALFDDSVSALLAVCALILPHFGFVGFPLIEFSLLNRTVALPLLLLAFALFFRGRTVAAFALLGATYNIHLLSVNFAILMMGAAMIVDRQHTKPRTVALACVAFVVTALPVIAWKLSTDPQLDLSIRPDWLWVVGRGMFWHIWHPLDGPLTVMALVIVGLSGLILAALALRAVPSMRAKPLRAMLIAGACVLVVQECVALVWPITVLMQLQLSRVSSMMLFLTYLCAAQALATALRSDPLTRGRWLLVALSLAVFPTPALALGAWLWFGFFEQAPRPALATVCLLMTLAASAMVLAVPGLWRPGFHPWGPDTGWEEAQRWARDHTAQDALFVTPPGHFPAYESGWRVYSRRRTLATMTDLLELALMPAAFDAWLPAFESVAPGAVSQFTSDYFANLSLVRGAYAGLRERDFSEIACRFGADYAVIEQPLRLDLPLMFENSDYLIYDLAVANTCAGSG